MHLLHRTRRQTASYSILTGPDDAVLEEFDLAQCCHCGLHFRIRPGSGMTRGWCTMCGQITCGSIRCQSCEPFEKKLQREWARARLLQALGL